MQIAIPHDLPRDEVRKRIQRSSHKIANYIPGGMAQISTDWASDDRMNLHISAMGQNLQGFVTIEDKQISCEIALPAAFAFIEPMVADAIRTKGQKLLAPSVGE